MQHIWRLQKAFLGEVVEQFTEPRPAYTTISTVIRTLETKGFVRHDVVGKSHRYYPAVSKEDYRSRFMQRVVSNFSMIRRARCCRFWPKAERLPSSNTKN